MCLLPINLETRQAQGRVNKAARSCSKHLHVIWVGKQIKRLSIVFVGTQGSQKQDKTQSKLVRWLGWECPCERIYSQIVTKEVRQALAGSSGEKDTGHSSGEFALQRMLKYCTMLSVVLSK